LGIEQGTFTIQIEGYLDYIQEQNVIYDSTRLFVLDSHSYYLC